MSTTIDERVVEMRFDNKQFEQGVQKSLSTIDKLKASLNFTGASKGLENISTAAKNVNLSGLGNAIETVRAKFSAFDVMAITAVSNLTNSAVNAGKKIASALTIDPIKSGFEEYETQINAVQTILANTESKGTTLNQVNDALDELNTYADKTIYNFTEMTRNIGTFTAAGVGLKESVSAIQGIANLAAVSGSTSQQASTAMYQLSQALAAGTVKLQDWNSVVNAGMGGELFQNALKRTATQMGYNVDAMIQKYGSFRESLTRGEWLTSEVLTETLAQLAGAYDEADLIAQGYSESQAREIVQLSKTAVNAATKVKTVTQLFDTLKEAMQSGWTQSWEIIIGDFEEAKDFLTEFSTIFGGIIGETANARNSLLEGGLGSGWNQMLNQGISDEEGFKEAIISTAKEHGIAIDEMIDSQGSFEKALKSGWMTSDILSESITKLADKTRNLSDEQLKEMGYSKSQINSLEQLEQSVKSGSISLDELAENMSRMSGRENILESLRGAFNAIATVVVPIKDAFREIFPPATAEQLYNLTVRIKEFTGGLSLTEEQSANLKSTFKGLFALLDIGVQTFSTFASGVGHLVSFFKPVGNGLLSFTGRIGDYVVALDEGLKKTNVFANALRGFQAATGSVVSGISRFVQNAKEFGKTLSLKMNFSPLEMLQAFLGRIVARMDQVREVASQMKASVRTSAKEIGNVFSQSPVLQILGALRTAIVTIGKGIADVAGKITESFTNALGSANFSGIFDLISSLSLGGIALVISKFLKSIKDSFDDAGGILTGITNILDGVCGSLEAFQTQLKAGTLLKIAAAIAVLTGSILVLSLIDSGKLTSSLMTITLLFTELMASMAVFSKISALTGKTGKACAAMISISAAVLILATAMRKLSGLSWEDIGQGIVGITALSSIMLGAAKMLSTGTKQIVRGSAGLILFAAAIKVLASACADLASFQWGELKNGLIGVGVLLGEVSVFLNTAKFSGKAISTGAGILVLAAAIKVLGTACRDFTGMSYEDLKKGLGSIGILLGELAAFTNLTGNAKGVLSTATSMIAIAGAMKIFSSVLSDFSKMEWEEIKKGLAALGGVLLSVAISVNMMPKNMIGIGVGMLTVSGAITVLSGALKQFSGMQWDEIGRGLTAMGGALLELVIGLHAMNGTLLGSAALIVAAGALAVIAPTMKLLGSMSWEAIGKGLLALAGAFAVIGGAGLLLTPLIPAILALSGAFALIGVAVVGIGVGLAAAGAGLSALAAGFLALTGIGAVGATSIVASLTIIVTGIAGLIPMVVGKIGEGMVLFARAITAGAPVIALAMVTLVGAIVTAITGCVPQIVDGVLLVVSEFLTSIAQYTPQIVQAVMNILLSIMAGIAANIPQFIQAGVSIITALLLGIGNAAPQLTDAGFKMIIDFINGTAESIRTNTPLLVDAMKNLGMALIEAILTVFSGGDQEFVSAGINMIQGFIQGIKKSFQGVVDAATEVVSGAVDAVKNFLGIASPSKLFTEIGQYSGDGLAKGLNNSKKVVGEAGAGLAKVAMTSTQKIMDEGNEKRLKNQEKSDKKSIKQAGDYWSELLKKYGDGEDQKEELNKQSIDDTEKTHQKVDSTHKKSVNSEQEYWEKLLAIKKKGTEASKYKNMDMAKFEKSILSDTMDLWKKYTESLQSNTDNLMGQVGLFSAVEKQQSVKKEDLMKNLQGQVEQYQTFATTLATVNARIADGGLKDAINELGIDSLAQLQAINSMTDEELTQYASLYDQKFALATNAASTQLSNLQAETEQKMSALYGGINVNALEFGKVFDGTIESIKQYVTASLDQAELAKDTGAQLVNGVAEGMASNDSANLAATDMIDSAEQAARTAAEINSPSERFRREIGTYLTEGVAGGMLDRKVTITDAVTQLVNTALDYFRNARSNFVLAGQNAAMGFREGILNKIGDIASAASQVANAAFEAAQQAIDSHSPSRKFILLGQYADMGFAMGLHNYAGKVKSASSMVGNVALTSMTTTMAMVSDLIENGIDTEPAIRPVLDLSNVNSGISQLSTAFGRSQALAISAGIGNPNASRIQNDGTPLASGNTYQFTQNNYSPKALSRTEIYRQTKNQFSALKEGLA
ncbi:MAG: tape measure protein [Eubacteriales bacterium]|nr:tape measure protein [Eubacteriales bacterium]